MLAVSLFRTRAFGLAAVLFGRGSGCANLFTVARGYHCERRKNNDPCRWQIPVGRSVHPVCKYRNGCRGRIAGA
jgi:hypothetical protein